MKTAIIPMRYILLTYRTEQFWLPAAFWVLFLFITFLMRNDGNSDNAIDAFLVGVLPLMTGVMAAYAVIDDPALELQFATPRTAWRTLVERLWLIFAVVSLAAISFQLAVVLVGGQLPAEVGLLERQLHWLVPSLALGGLGCLAALALAQCTFGSLVTGLVWIFQVIAQSWFVYEPKARLVFLLIGAFSPDHPDRWWTYGTLTALAVLFLGLSWALLKKQERYI